MTPANQQNNKLLHFKAVVPPETVDMERKTFRVLVNSGEKVMRYGWEGLYYLTLSMDPAHVRFDRLKSGAVPLMKDHAAYSIDDQLGVVESAELDKGKLYADCRMAADETKYLARLAEGTLRNVSPGVFVYKLKDVTPEGATTKEFLAVDWEPYEISMVAVPADKNAQVLSLAEALSMCGAPAPDSPLEESMNEQLNPGQAPASPPPSDPTQTTLAAQQTERQRVLGITNLANAHGMPAEFLSNHISSGTELSQVQSLILADLSQRSAANPTNPMRGEVTRDRFDSVRVGLGQALQYRVQANIGSKTRVELNEGKEFRGFTLLEMCRAYLQAQGVKEMPENRMSLVAAALGFERLAGQHSTSDFPNILANVANKSLLQGYEYANPTYRVWSRRSTASDFKSISRVQFGDFPTLTKVNEGGEFKYGSIGEGAEAYALATYGRIVAITRQAIINDDLDAFSRVPMNIGAAAAYLENFTVYQILIANAAMRDGVALFHASHGNLAGSNSAISIASLGLGRAAMRKQKGLDGTTMLNLTPKFLIVPPELETVALQQTSNEYVPEAPGNVNVFKGTLTPVVDSQLTSATNWFMATDPNLGNTVEYSFLEGQEGVYTEQRVGFEVDGIEIKARLDFAAKGLDWRGLYKNVGA
jgi:phage major head subunit gpT-like protein